MSSRDVLAENLKRLRQKRGFTQLEVSEESGITRPYLAKVESGSVNISIDTLDRISEVLETETWKLIKPSDKGSLSAVSRVKPKSSQAQRRAVKG